MVAIVIMLAWAQIAFGGGGPYELDPDGMMRPDGMIQQQPPGHKPLITYNAKRLADGSYLITRNGVGWITVTAKKNQYLVSDPNGSGQTVLKLDFSSAHYGSGASVKLRASTP